jgi:hypothetical protein
VPRKYRFGRTLKQVVDVGIVRTEAHAQHLVLCLIARHDLVKLNLFPRKPVPIAGDVLHISTVMQRNKALLDEEVDVVE